MSATEKRGEFVWEHGTDQSVTEHSGLLGTAYETGDGKRFDWTVYDPLRAAELAYGEGSHDLSETMALVEAVLPAVAAPRRSALAAAAQSSGGPDGHPSRDSVLLVTGSHLAGPAAVRAYLDGYRAALPAGSQMVVVHGDWPEGADAHAAAWCAEQRAAPRPDLADVVEEPYPAADGSDAAGTARTVVMVEREPRACAGFFSSSRCRCETTGGAEQCGTHGCLEMARAAGVPCTEVRPPARD